MDAQSPVHYHCSILNCVNGAHSLPLCQFPGGSAPVSLRRGALISCTIAEVTCEECKHRATRAVLGDPEMPRNLCAGEG